MVWIVIYQKYIPENNTLLGAYVDLFDSEEKADKRFDKLKAENWIVRKESKRVE